MTACGAVALPAKPDPIARKPDPDPKSRSPDPNAEATAAATPLIKIFDNCRAAHFPGNGRAWPNATDGDTAREWRDHGKSLGLSDDGIAEIVGDVCDHQCQRMAAKAKGPPNTLKLFDNDVKAGLTRAAGKQPKPVDCGVSYDLNGPEDPRWPMRVKWWRDKPESWSLMWGPPPGEPRCWVPRKILAEYGVSEAAA
jgi:hypothetical protein